MKKMIRQPVVAGQFYPGDKEKLKIMIERCFTDKKIGPGKLPDLTSEPKRTGNIFGLISPHAGYVYSGSVAAHGYLEQFADGKPDFFIIIGPNHSNNGPGISVYPPGKWKTPFGGATIPEEIVKKIVKEAYFREDKIAHMQEHSIEVQVPFLQYLYGADVPIVPICLKDQSLEMSIRVGNVLSKALKDYDFCMIASTDLTHYTSHEVAMEKDSYVIECIKNLDASGLIEVVQEKQITMCGPGPVASVLTASNQNNVQSVDVLKYATSGEVSGDRRHVVAYVSAILKK
jgi:hypothetical protein